MARAASVGPPEAGVDVDGGDEKEHKSRPSPHTSAWLELLRLLQLSWPRSVAELLNFMPRLVALALSGHLSEGALVTAAGIGIMYSNMVGNMLLKSSAFGATSLLSQAHGAANHRRVGELLQRMVLLHLCVICCFSLPLAAAAPLILRAVGQPNLVVTSATRFIWLRLLGLPGLAISTDINLFLVAQRCVRAPMVISIASSLVQVLLASTLESSLGFDGAPLAMTAVECLQALLLFVAAPLLLRREKLPSWPQRAEWRAATRGWVELISQGAPAAAMVISEWLGWECTLFIASGLCTGARSCPPLEAFPICTTLMVGQVLHFCAAHHPCESLPRPIPTLTITRCCASRSRTAPSTCACIGCPPPRRRAPLRPS